MTLPFVLVNDLIIRIEDIEFVYQHESVPKVTVSLRSGRKLEIVEKDERESIMRFFENLSQIAHPSKYSNQLNSTRRLS